MNKSAKEFDFTKHHFDVLRGLVNRHTGITLADSKMELVYGRLARRLRALNISSFDQYCRMLKTDPGDELNNFVNAITTNKTDFFREMHHFEYLTNTALPYLLKERKNTKRIRIWSAGCSTGQEPYSIAMVIHDAVRDLANWDVKILATDIDSNVINTARNGVYQQEQIKLLPQDITKKWFSYGSGENAGKVKVAEKLKDIISFKVLNLMEQWPMKGKFDILFCRNVVIYFNKSTQAVLFDRFAEYLQEDGILFIGHSESLHNISNKYDHIGQTIHKKKA